MVWKWVGEKFPPAFLPALSIHLVNFQTHVTLLQTCAELSSSWPVSWKLTKMLHSEITSLTKARLLMLLSVRGFFH
jgi:hypothetical protein